jgi:hypothetical protein
MGKPLVGPRKRLDDNSKMYIREADCKEANWAKLVQGNIQR